MSSQAISAFQTYLQIGDGGSPESFTTIAELRNISGPNFSSDVIDVTVHNTSTPFRRFISGLIDGGEITIDINFVPTDATHGYSSGLLADMINRTRRNFQLVFPDSGSTTWLIPGIVTAFEPSADPGDVLQASVTIKVSGPPTLE